MFLDGGMNRGGWEEPAMEATFCDKLADALGDVIWSVPCTQLEASDPMFRRLTAAAGLKPGEVLAKLADETLALAMQKNFLRKLAFEELLVTRYEQRLWHWFLSRTGHKELALDLTQDLYLKLLNMNVLGAYNANCAFEPWLWKVVRNLWVDEWRRTRKQVQLAERDWEDRCPSPPDEVACRELEERFEVAVRALPDLQQRVIREAMNGANAESMARDLRLVKSQVFQLLFKARRQLERVLGLKPDIVLPQADHDSISPIRTERIPQR
jgi:RNA polymerase sigma-70 factor, ECF subfamily